MSLYLFLDMYLHSGEYHVGTVGIDIRNWVTGCKVIDGSSGIFDFVFHLVELSRVDERGCSLLLPYRTVPGITNIIVQVVNSGVVPVIQ